MRLRRLRLCDFRHVTEREVTFEDGVTIVEGPNEVGKSALADALRLLLDPKLKHSSEAKEVKRECPEGRQAWPTIEAEIECGEWRFVFRKRFARGAAGGTELEIVEPKRETLKGDDAMLRVGRILGDEVDLPLFDALQVAQGKGIDRLSLSGGGWLGEALDRAAGGATDGAGDRHEPLFARVTEEFERYYTSTGKEKAGGDLARLRKEAADLSARADEAEAALAAARSAVEEFESIDDEVRDLERRLPERIAERDTAQRALDELTGKVDELRRLEPELGDKRELLERLERSATDRVERAARIEREQTALDGERLALATLEQQLETDSEAEQRATEALEAAERRHQAAVALRDLRQRDVDDQRHAQHITELERRREELATLLQELEPLEQLAAHVIDERTAHAVTTADARLNAARESASLGAPKVEIEALSDLAIQLDGEPTPLGRGDRLTPRLREQLEIRIPDEITVRIRPGRSSDGLRDAVEGAERDLAAALRAVGTQSVKEARELWDDVQQARAQITPKRKRIEELSADLGNSERGPLAALDDALDAARTLLDGSRTARPAEPEPPADAVAAERLLQDAVRGERDAEQATRTRREASQALRDDLAKLRSEVDTARTRIELGAKRLASDRRSLDEDRGRESDSALASKLEAARGSARETERKIASLRTELAEADLEGKRQAAENARQVVLDRTREFESRREARIRLHDRVQRVGGQGLFEARDEARRAHDEVAAQLARVEARAKAALRLRDTLTTCRDEVRRRYRDPLRERIEALAHPVFGDDLHVELGEGLTIATRTLGGITLPFDQLSVGAREQLDLIHRVAVAQLVAEQGGVPLILDDTLGSADPERLKAMNLLLARAGEQVQVIVLTCHPERFDRVGGARKVRLTPPRSENG